MVEGTYEFCCFEIFQNTGFSYIFHREYFHHDWESFEFHRISRMFFHRGWREFWIPKLEIHNKMGLRIFHVEEAIKIKNDAKNLFHWLFTDWPTRVIPGLHRLLLTFTDFSLKTYFFTNWHPGRGVGDHPNQIWPTTGVEIENWVTYRKKISMGVSQVA